MTFGYVLPDLSHGTCKAWDEVPKECIWVGDCKTGMHEGDYWVLTERVRGIWMHGTDPDWHPLLRAFHDDPSVKAGVMIGDKEWERSKEVAKKVQAEITGCGGCG